MLSSVTKSEYTIIENTKDFVSKINNKFRDKVFKMVSIDVSNLFTNVPLDLSKIYKDEEISTKFQREELHRYYVCVQRRCIFHSMGKFSTDKIVPMGSPLSPVLANIFMVHFATNLIPMYNKNMPPWLHHLDNTFMFITEENITEVIKTFFISDLNLLNRYIVHWFSCEKQN